MKAQLQFVEGLRAVAEKGRMSISEAAMLGIADELWGGKADADDIISIVAAYHELNPGLVYVQALRTLGDTDKVLRNSALTLRTDAIASSSLEHLGPLSAAFTFLTGQELPDID